MLVRIEGPRSFHARTDRNGQAKFSEIPPGSYLLEVAPAEPLGWVLDGEIDVRPGEESRKELKLGQATIRSRVIAEGAADMEVLATTDGC